MAIKKIPRAFQDVGDAKRILREIKLLRYFQHDNVRFMFQLYCLACALVVVPPPMLFALARSFCTTFTLRLNGFTASVTDSLASCIAAYPRFPCVVHIFARHGSFVFTDSFPGGYGGPGVHRSL